MDDTYELGELVAVQWCPQLAERFPTAKHDHCFQLMHYSEGSEYPQPFVPARCRDWHCPKCGAPTNMYGHH